MAELDNIKLKPSYKDRERKWEAKSQTQGGHTLDSHKEYTKTPK